MKKKKSKFILYQYWQNILRAAISRGTALTFGISVLVAATFAAGFYYLVLSDLLASNTMLAEEVVKKEGENSRGQLVEKNEPQFQAEFKKLVNLSEAAEPLLPEATEIAATLAGVQEISRRSAVTLTGLNAVKESIKSAVADKTLEREIPAQVTGQPAAVVHFFYDLARLSRIIVVRDFEMTALSPNQVQATFTLVTYHAPPPTDIPALPSFINAAKPAALAQNQVDQK